MKMQLQNNLKALMPDDESIPQLFQLIGLPDTKFDQIYPQLQSMAETTFKSEAFQKDVLQNLTVYKANNEIDIEAERATVEELIKEIKEDDTLSANKQTFLISILEAATLSVYDLMQNPRERIEVKIKVLPGGKIPTYAHPTDAGADVYASEPTNFEPYETKIVHTALQVAIPAGYEIQIRPRSGMSLKTSFRIANAPGTIDSDYRGEIGVIMTNISNKPAAIEKGDKIAQMVIAPVPMIKWVETDNLDETERGEGGFGSTDKS